MVCKCLLHILLLFALYILWLHPINCRIWEIFCASVDLNPSLFFFKGRFCWQRLLQLGDVYVSAGLESKVARLHHSPPGEPWEQADNTSVWILWWVSHLIQFATSYRVNVFVVTFKFLFYIFRWVPNKIWKRKRMAILHKSVWHANCGSCELIRDTHIALNKNIKSQSSF